MSLYFAFGSNLDLRQMKRRCPSATEIGVGVAHGWELRFAGWSHGWGGAVADIVRTPGAEAGGAVYEVPFGELVGRMDAFEGCPLAYQRIRIDVEMANSQEVRCWTYAKAMDADAGVPSARYFATIWYGYEARGMDTQPLIDALCREPRRLMRATHDGNKRKRYAP